MDQDQESASLAPDGVWVAVGAMVEYLLHKHGPGKLKVPQGGRQYADYLQVACPCGKRHLRGAQRLASCLSTNLHVAKRSQQ